MASYYCPTMVISSCIILLLMSAPAALGQECWCDPAKPSVAESHDVTSNTSKETTTDLTVHPTEPSTSTTEQEQDRFPPGDVFNDPWFKKVKFCFRCYDETKLQGLRNFWPYTYIVQLDGQYSMAILHSSGIIASDPILQSKLYCFLLSYPSWADWSVFCYPGNSSFFSMRLSYFPMGMMRDNIPLSVFNAVLAFCSLLFGILGNILIIFAISTRKELKTTTNMMLLGMAVADCLNSITLVGHSYLESFLWTVTNPLLGPIGCGIVKQLQAFTQLAALNHLVTLSFERYFTICWPMKQSLKFTKKKLIYILIINWIIAVIQLIPTVLFNFRLEEHRPDYFCHRSIGLRNEYPKVALSFDLIIYLGLPIPILCFNYISVVRSLLTSIKKSREMTGDASGKTQAEKARLKLTYMMITLVVIYIVTVTPGRVMDALKDLVIFNPKSMFYIKKVAATIDMVRGINSWTNVIVYTIISRQFRTAFKEILCPCLTKREAENPNGKIPDGSKQTFTSQDQA